MCGGRGGVNLVGHRGGIPPTPPHRGGSDGGYPFNGGGIDSLSLTIRVLSRHKRLSD